MTDSYDELPYSNNAFGTTYPVQLASVAALHGLAPPDPRRCRVLELGCGRGGNLLPMAETLPESEFVGIDLSQGHIDEALADTQALGFSNVRFEAADILEVDSQYGQFDYIIAHGVYSWVPEVVQRKILDLCRSLLTPRGIAYISYNTLPGWHYRGVVREMLRYHVTREAPARVQLDQARSFLDFVSKVVPDREGVRSRLLREECDYMVDESDSYLFHEHLEANNRPCYFHEFASQLTELGLQYVGESQVDPLRMCLPDGADEALRKVCPDDRIRYEQHLDYLTHRTFRRSLVCHSDAAVCETMTTEPLSSCWFRTDAAPVDAEVDVPSGNPVEFRAANNVEIATEHPLVQSALYELSLRAPLSLSFEELATAVSARAGCNTDDPEFAAELKNMLLACYQQAMLEIRLVPPHCAPEISTHPQASACARLQARGDSCVTNSAHQSVGLDPLGRYLLSHIDGTRTRDDLVQLLVEHVRKGDFAIESNENESLPDEDVPEYCSGIVEKVLASLVAHRLLIA